MRTMVSTSRPERYRRIRQPLPAPSCVAHILAGSAASSAQLRIPAAEISRYGIVGSCWQHSAARWQHAVRCRWRQGARAAERLSATAQLEDHAQSVATPPRVRCAGPRATADKTRANGRITVERSELASMRYFLRIDDLQMQLFELLVRWPGWARSSAGPAPAGSSGTW